MIPTIYPWQSDQWQSLAKALTEDRLAHAYLLAGSVGIGKSHFAGCLASLLVCKQPQMAQACGECESCQLTLAGNHPDFRHIEVEEGKRQIRVEQVRDIQHFTNQTSFAGGRKVVVVNPAEAMNNSTANAFLKTLEEPAGNTILILCTDAPGQLLATIRSRCRVMDFPMPSSEMALAWLTERVGERDSEALLIEAAGQPLAALELFKVDGLSQRRKFDQLINSLFTYSVSVVDASEQFMESSLDEFLLWLHQRLLAVSKAQLASQSLAADYAEAWQPAVKCSPRGISECLAKVGGTAVQLSRGGNPNARSTIESILLDLLATAKKRGF